MENMVLEQLRRIRASQDRMELDLQDVKIRVTAIEQHLGQVQIQIASLNGRMDRFDERLTRIERRLDLAEA
jgi:predicted  nucleic acid-binding Zn-ribbon protein